LTTRKNIGKTPAKVKSNRGRKPVLSMDIVASNIVLYAGNLSRVAKACHVARSCVHDFINIHPQLKKLIDDARESMIDDAVDGLHKAVKSGEAWAICFLLKCQGRARGYSEKHELTVEAVRREIVEEIVDAPTTATITNISQIAYGASTVPSLPGTV
jgi:hypothetical protein